MRISFFKKANFSQANLHSDRQISDKFLGHFGLQQPFANRPDLLVARARFRGSMRARSLCPPGRHAGGAVASEVTSAPIAKSYISPARGAGNFLGDSLRAARAGSIQANFSEIFARCARRHILNQIWRNPHLGQCTPASCVCRASRGTRYGLRLQRSGASCTACGAGGAFASRRLGRPRSCLQIRWPRVMRIPDDTDHRTPGGQLCGGARSRGRGRG